MSPGRLQERSDSCKKIRIWAENSKKEVFQVRKTVCAEVDRQDKAGLESGRILCSCNIKRGVEGVEGGMLEKKAELATVSKV